MQIQIYITVNLQIYFSCQRMPLKLGITHSHFSGILYEMWIIFSWLIYYFWSLLFSSNNLKILWHHCQCKVDLTVVNNASICVIRQLSVETTFVLIQLKLNPMYTNEQASNLSPTILTVLDGPYRRLSVFVRGCWGLFSCIVHTVMDFAMKYIFLVSNH